MTLGVLLRSRYPTLRCFVFSPPGGTFSRELCRLTETFALSVVVGDDAIPRLGVAQLEELKRQMLTCLVENDRPKHEILTQGLGAYFCNLRSRQNCPRMTGHTTARYKEMKQQKMDKILNTQLEASASGSTNLFQDKPESTVRFALGTVTHNKLFPPGRILYLIETHYGFEPWWASADYFDHVIISPHMLTDHLPDVCYRALKHVCDRTFEHL
ncbi:electroneutral sodium bicarbonate exchanger 1-like [Tropilaelaps mercedesae]|uniref:Electroneutral sodium bicarbonate exchanger 1-like n=1 Tax=Tropilaelaps mercedesae TaxID=418985 RepID=A0A1V9X8S5_9ACAR|nr:electroneutral sodium bicarbonate exchanger 1-like [Tropilaelaps mercedesae]